MFKNIKKFFSTNEKQILSQIIRNNIAYKQTIIGMIENLELTAEIKIDDNIRGLKQKQLNDLNYLNNLMIQQRIAPSLLQPLSSSVLSSIAGISGIFSERFAKQTALVVEKLSQDQIDENIRSLNEMELQYHDLRYNLCQMRDEGNQKKLIQGYDLLQNIQNEIDSQKCLIQNENLKDISKEVFSYATYHLINITNKL